MTPDNFIEHFATFAAAPNGVAKLRELILQLAVHGKLVPQDENDEPASVLKSKILAKRKRSVESRDMTATATATEWPDGPLPHSLPDGWEWIRLGEFGWFLGGGTPSKERAEFWTGDIPWVSPKDMNRPYMDDVIDHVSPLGVENSSGKMIPKGSLLMVVRGMILAHSFPVALAMRELTINQDMKALQLTMPELGEYLLRCCAAIKFRMLANVERSSHGTCRLPTEAVANFPIPLPPLAEQRRIAGKVDQLLALCDELATRQESRRAARSALVVATLDRLTSPSAAAESASHAKRLQDHFDLLFDSPTTIPHLRQAILQLAVQGQLVPQDPNDEPADIVANDRDTDRPFDIPSHWRWGLVGQVAEARLGKMLDNAKNFGTPRVYLRNTNVHWMRFDLTSLKEMPFKDGELDEFEVRRGDVLICEGGHGIGRSAVWEGQHEQVMFQKALHRVRPRKDLDGYFFTFCMRVYDAIGVLQTYYTGAGIPHLTGRSLAKLLFPVPPLAEQKRIVSKVTELLSPCDALESQLQSTESASTQLLASAVNVFLGAPKL